MASSNTCVDCGQTRSRTAERCWPCWVKRNSAHLQCRACSTRLATGNKTGLCAPCWRSSVRRSGPGGVAPCSSCGANRTRRSKSALCSACWHKARRRRLELPRTCPLCSELKPGEDFITHPAAGAGRRIPFCRPCNKAWHRRYRLLKKYGISSDDYDQLLAAQDGRCAICQEHPGERPLHVDHDHVTGSIRGLLCLTCNAGLGALRDSSHLLRAALTYLDRQPTTPTRRS